jgi:hypothetical protein
MGNPCLGLGVRTAKRLYPLAQGRRFGAPWVSEEEKHATPKGLDNQAFSCPTPSG